MRRGLVLFLAGFLPLSLCSERIPCGRRSPVAARHTSLTRRFASVRRIRKSGLLVISKILPYELSSVEPTRSAVGLWTIRTFLDSSPRLGENRVKEECAVILSEPGWRVLLGAPLLPEGAFSGILGITSSRRSIDVD
jgi:hypothetical protein